MCSDSLGLDVVSSCRGVTVSTKTLCGQTQSLSIAKEGGRSIRLLHFYDILLDPSLFWQ